MKKILMAMLVAAGCFAAVAATDDVPAWKTTLAKVKNLPSETGIAGFMKKEAPAYITGNFAEADRPAAPDFTKPLAPAAEYANKNGFWVTTDAQVKAYSTEKHPVKKGDWIGGYFDDSGRFVAGHEVKTLFGMPYGVGQLIMIPLCLIMMYLAIPSDCSPALPGSPANGRFRAFGRQARGSFSSR